MTMLQSSMQSSMQLINSLSAARFFRSHELYETFDIERKFEEDISNLIFSADTVMTTTGCIYTRDEHRFKHRLSDACNLISNQVNRMQTLYHWVMGISTAWVQ